MEKRFLSTMILVLLSVGLLAGFALSADVSMITKDQLKAMLGKPDLVIFDFRLAGDYSSSDLKIKGAVRSTAFCSAEAVQPYSKEHTFVFYCASPNEERSVMNLKHLATCGVYRAEAYKKVYVLKGGWEEWLKANYPTEKK